MKAFKISGLVAGLIMVIMLIIAIGIGIVGDLPVFLSQGWVSQHVDFPISLRGCLGALLVLTLVGSVSGIIGIKGTRITAIKPE